MRPRALDDPAMIREIVTPEGIPLRFTLASAGDRVAAFAIDMAIQIAALIAVSWALATAVGDEHTWLSALVVLLAFVLLNFYFAAFEIRWQGATPGKRAIGIRVIDARGGQLETSAVLARNLLRELEVWTPLRVLVASDVVWPDAPVWARLAAGAWTLVLLLLPLCNRDRLRVGDLVAGTRVVLQPRVVLVPDLVDDAPAPGAPLAAGHAFTDDQLAIYGIYELQVLEGVLRAPPGDPAHRDAIRTVSEKVRQKIRYDAHVADDERFLRDFYAAQRAHLERGMLLGKRRADKFS